MNPPLAEKRISVLALFLGTKYLDINRAILRVLSCKATITENEPASVNADGGRSVWGKKTTKVL